MPSLFDTLNIGARSLQAHQQAMQATGHNIANVNNPAYTRQRVILQTSSTLEAPYGPLGSGVDIAGVQRLRNELTDQQIQGETSVRGYLEAQQKALQYAQAGLGQTLSTGDATQGSPIKAGVNTVKNISVPNFLSSSGWLTAAPIVPQATTRTRLFVFDFGHLLDELLLHRGGPFSHPSGSSARHQEALLLSLF